MTNFGDGGAEAPPSRISPKQGLLATIGPCQVPQPLVSVPPQLPKRRPDRVARRLEMRGLLAIVPSRSSNRLDFRLWQVAFDHREVL